MSLRFSCPLCCSSTPFCLNRLPPEIAFLVSEEFLFLSSSFEAWLACFPGVPCPQWALSSNVCFLVAPGHSVAQSFVHCNENWQMLWRGKLLLVGLPLTFLFFVGPLPLEVLIALIFLQCLHTDVLLIFWPAVVSDGKVHCNKRVCHY